MPANYFESLKEFDRNATSRWELLLNRSNKYTSPFLPTARCTDLQIQFTDAVSTVADQKELITKLEHDLSTVQSLSAMHRPDAEVSSLAEAVPRCTFDQAALTHNSQLSAFIFEK